MEMTECGAQLRMLGDGASSLEETADRTVRYLYDHLIDTATGKRACALVRFFKTHPFEALAPELQAFARSMLGRDEPFPGMRCLTLMATTGERPEWQAPERSVGHKAIPLPSSHAVAQAPMISQLVEQLGLEVSSLVRRDDHILLDAEQRTYNVFYVPEARGSPYIPAQDDFVIPLGIRSVLGFGGILPLGDLFAVILFSKSYIPRETSELFKPLALCTKVAVLPFVGRADFS